VSSDHRDLYGDSLALALVLVLLLYNISRQFCGKKRFYNHRRIQIFYYGQVKGRRKFSGGLQT